MNARIIIDIAGPAHHEAHEATYEITATGVRWTLTGKLAKALSAKEDRIERLEKALRESQLQAGHELTQLTSNHPYYRVFETFHRVAAGALSSGEPTTNYANRK